MGCENCTQEQINKYAKSLEVLTKAQEEANRTGEWFAIYTDERGRKQYIIANQSSGIPIEQYLSPKL